jgi:hypothetical protein
VSTIDPIRIHGLREFQQALRQMDGESQKQLRVALNTAAGLVVTGASRRVPVRTGAARASLRTQSSQREARVAGGSRKAPYYGWLDFGGRIGRDKATRRPFVRSGRYIYPAYAANRQGVERALNVALVDLARMAGLQVTSG